MIILNDFLNSQGTSSTCTALRFENPLRGPAASSGGCIFMDFENSFQVSYLEIPSSYFSTSISFVWILLWNRDHQEAIESLTNLRLLIETSMPGGLPGWILNDKFRHNLKIALLGG